MQELKDKVVQILITNFDLLSEEASEMVDTSVTAEPQLWSENSDPQELANYLANEEDSD